MDMKQISSLLAAVVLLLLCGGCDFRTTREKAEQGDADAQLKLGVMYFFGDGVPLDDAEAVKWFRKAAMQGHTMAQRNLGFMYYGGGKGVRKDKVEAYTWVLLADAISKSDSLSSISFDHMNPDNIGFYISLRPEERKKGRARAAELLRLIKERNSKWFEWRYKAEDGVYKYNRASTED